MSWAIIIQGLMSLFGPLLSDVLKKWLDSLFRSTAANLPDPVDAGDLTKLFDEAIARTGRPLRRMLLRRMRASAVKNAAAVMSGNADNISVEDAADVFDAVRANNED
jgi:hypothetical protein